MSLLLLALGYVAIALSFVWLLKLRDARRVKRESFLKLARPIYIPIRHDINPREFFDSSIETTIVRKGSVFMLEQTDTRDVQ